MHQLYGGVCKLLLEFLTQVGNNRLSKQLEHQLNCRLLSCKRYWPLDFQRKPEIISVVSKWKCTQYRHFLLYLGPAVLREIVSPSYYHCFIYLHVAARILSSKSLCASPVFLGFCEKLLIIFVQNFQSVIGRQFCTYNVHTLLHLVDDVKKFGPLDSFSAFRFENYLRSLSSKIKPCGRELQQLGRRLSEEKYIKVKRVDNSIKMSNELEIGFYKSLKYEWHLIINDKDNYVRLKNNKLCKITSFFKRSESYMFSAKIFTNTTSVYNSPIDSKIVFQYCKVSVLSEFDSTFPITDIESKCIYLQFEEACYLIPLLPKS